MCYLSWLRKLKKCYLSWLRKRKMCYLSWLRKQKKHYMSWLRNIQVATQESTPRLYNISLLTRMLTRLYITRMLTRLESNLVITQSCGISYHLYSCCSIILVVTVLSTFLWHYSQLIFLSLYHSCGYSLVNILVRYFTLDNLAIGQSFDRINLF